jgi:hypothetical protein
MRIRLSRQESIDLAVYAASVLQLPGPRVQF